ncbi:MAG: HIRAN domain-containing protein [Lachnospiraceae bacterium]|nr:HIRAN domain-containing protein [Lachnospiraceae bacterium]
MEPNIQIAEQSMRGGYYRPDAFVQKKRLLLILKTGVAGVFATLGPLGEEGEAILDALTPGTELKLYRDVGNEHDVWAVSVHTTDGRKVGYLTRFKNETVARLLDYGKTITAQVDEPVPEPEDETERRRTRAYTEDYRLPISVYMEE